MSEAQRYKSDLPRYVAAAEAAVVASTGPLALSEPRLSDRDAMKQCIHHLMLALRELCRVHDADPDIEWNLAKFRDQE